MRICHFQAQNVTFVLNKLFSVQTIIITFIYQLALFIVQNFKKILQWIQSYEYAPFLGTKWFIYSNFFFLEKIINIIFIYPSAPFTVQNLKNNSYNGSSYEDAPFLGPKWPICPNENFFRKPVNKPCSFHSCLPTSQNSVRY